ncbi:hypothetical protein TWF694_007240 [Orbilia ellipsospora]|uniref:Rhodopsin domain-containing protein n=1 Tax=Orbilia ellipsospora TaxID=2528407 RepID=A0AAV9XHN8_9PEZI
MGSLAPPPPEEMSQRTTTLAIASASFAIATFGITLRLYVRVHIMKQPSWDDWVMVVAWISMATYLCLIGFLTKYGLGIRREYFNPEWYRSALMIGVGIEAVCYCIITAVKISILLLYLRFVPYRTTRALIVSTIYLLVGFMTICEIVVFLQCRPLRSVWDLNVTGDCINMTAFLYSTAVLHILLDVWVLVLPIPTLLKIKRPGTQKVVLLGIFLIGGLAAAVSCVRLYAIRIFTTSNDPIYDATPINIWSFIEMGLGILCACIPTLRPLFPKIGGSGYTETFETGDEATTLNERSMHLTKPDRESGPLGSEEVAFSDLSHNSSLSPQKRTQSTESIDPP